MDEIWKDVVGYEGRYQVSNLGRVKSLRKLQKNGWRGWSISNEKIMNFTVNVDGYYTVVLRKNFKASTKRVNRLVAESFIENPNNLPEVNHINCIKTDNRVENLEWITRKDNLVLAHQNGLYKNPAKPCLGKFGKDAFASKSVIQYDANMNFIAEFDSMNIAMQKTGIQIARISESCHNKHPKKIKYIWRFNPTKVPGILFPFFLLTQHIWMI